MKKTISIIFSFKNEEECLNELLKRTLNSIKDIDLNFEFIFFNDGSDDNSQDIIEKYLVEIKKLNYQYQTFYEKNNIGVFPSLKKSLKNCKGDAAIYLDCDLQDPPELIPEMINLWMKGNLIVNTVRKKRYGESISKMILTKFAYKIINLISDKKITENSGDYKLIDLQVIKKITNIRDEDPFLRHLVNTFGFKSTIVYYDRDKRGFGESKFQLNSSISPYIEFQKGIFLTNNKISVISFLLFILFVFLSLTSLVFYIIIKKNLFLLIFILLILISLFLFLISLNSFFLLRIYKMINKI